jgi:hypothetical protein
LSGYRPTDRSGERSVLTGAGLSPPVEKAGYITKGEPLKIQRWTPIAGCVGLSDGTHITYADHRAQIARFKKALVEIYGLNQRDNDNVPQLIAETASKAMLGCTEDEEAGLSDNDLGQVKLLAYKMGRKSLKQELEDWLNNGFEYENSALTVHNVREVLQRYTQND